MKIVSLVPSWTETLLAAGVDVVGRTRFCVHPAAQVKAIPTIGGTKNWDWSRILEMKPDLLILDREENPRFMAEQTEIPWWASHITKATDVAPQLRELAKRLGGNSQLREWADAWQAETARVFRPDDWSRLPGVIEWGRKPTVPIEKVVYVIWREPWMCVTRSTFIGSMLELNGVSLEGGEVKYPEFSLESLDPSRTLLLFSSEPFPFLRRRPPEAQEFAHAFVDGECWSWFGLRALRFLQARPLA